MNTKEIVMSVFSVALKVVVLVIAVMFIYKYALIAYDYGYRLFGEKPMTEGEGRTVSVTVSPQMSVKEIGQALENKALIRDANLFVFQEKLSEHKGKIKPGIYELNTSMTAEEMIAVMASDSENETSDDDDMGSSYINKETEASDFIEEDAIPEDVMPVEGMAEDEETE